MIKSLWYAINPLSIPGLEQFTKDSQQNKQIVKKNMVLLRPHITPSVIFWGIIAFIAFATDMGVTILKPLGAYLPNVTKWGEVTGQYILACIAILTIEMFFILSIFIFLLCLSIKFQPYLEKYKKKVA